MKNPKTTFLLIFLFVTLLMTAQTEKGFYLGLNSGYSLGTGNANIYQAQFTRVYNETEINSSTTKFELVKTNLGAGLNFGFQAGYMFNPNLGFELGANYLLGSEITGKQTKLDGDFTNAELSAKMIQIKPTLVFRGGYATINPYAKVGMVIGSGKITNNTEDKDGPDVTKTTYEFSEGIPIGFHASLGTTYKLSNEVSLFGELNLIHLEYAPKKGKLSSYIENGVEQISGFNTSDSEFEFVDGYSSTSGSPNPNEPSKVLKLPFSFSSMGVNVGVLYHF
jgi:opacity protein-like surface antigen